MIIELILIILFLCVVTGIAVLLGEYMAKVFSGETTLLTSLIKPIEMWIYQLCSIDDAAETSWKSYAVSLLIFNILGFIALFTLQEVQGWLVFNPQGLGPVRWDTALNTAVSFVTNTNWQSYSGEQTMSYLTQMMGMTVQNFLSAAIGLSVAIALIRGFVRKTSSTIGNFWIDLTRSVLYILMPLALLWAFLLASQGVVQTLSPYITAQTLDGNEQVIAFGPAASQIAIKMLGSNGGGFFNANSAHPFENPTFISNIIENFSILLIPFAFVFMSGFMLNNKKQARAIFITMSFLFLAGLSAIL